MFLDGANDTLCTPHTVIYVCAKHTHTHPRTPSISWQRFHFSYLIKVDGKSFKLSIKKNNTKSCHKSRRKAEPIYLSSQQGRQRKQVEGREEGRKEEGEAAVEAGECGFAAN